MAQDSGGGQERPLAGAALALAEALAERLCHDIAGALGSLAGTLELARQDSAMLAEALPLAEQAAAGLIRRLRLVRAAWGGGEACSTLQLRELARGIPLGRRCTLSLEALPEDAAFTAPQAQLLLNVFMLAIEALGGEGAVAVRLTGPGETLITAQGRRCAWPEDFAAQLSDPLLALAAAGAGPRHVQGPMVALIAHRAGIRITMLHASEAHPAPPLLVRLDG